MSYHTVEDGPWPKGTTVGVWPAASVVGGAPSGMPVDTAVADPSGTATFAGLTEGQLYTALGHGGSQTFEAVNEESRLRALEAESATAVEAYWNASHADDTQSFIDAQLAAVAAGHYSVHARGGKGHGTAGAYSVGGVSVPGYANCGVRVLSKIRLWGDGPGSTVIRQRADEGNNMVCLNDCTDSTLEGVWVFGNWPTYSVAGQGVIAEASGGNTRVTVKNCVISDCGSYGIGFQNGTLTDVTIRDVVISNVGADGIDFKNVNGDNTGSILSDIRIRRHGQRTSLVGQTGIDMRGPCRASNIWVTNFGNVASSTDGIRFQGGVLADVDAGVGARRSSLTNFYVEAEASVASTIGVEVAPERVAVSNGQIKGCGVGLYVGPVASEPFTLYTVVSNVLAEGCLTYGFRNVTNTKHVSFVNCVADNCAVNFRLEGAFTRVIGGSTVNGTIGLDVPAAASDTSVVGLSFEGNATKLADGGTRTRIRGCPGLVTESNTLSSTFSVASPGSNVIDVPHGLDVTPAAKDCAVTVIAETAVGDYEISLVQIPQAPDSTNVRVRVVVKTASGTGGATARVGVLARAKT